MKFLNYELSDWVRYSNSEYPIPNWYRNASPWRNPPPVGYDFRIGFRQQDNKTPLIENQRWCLNCMTNGVFVGIEHWFYSLWNKNGSDRLISWKQLKQSKRELDELLVRFDRLKGYL